MLFWSLVVPGYGFDQLAMRMRLLTGSHNASRIRGGSKRDFLKTVVVVATPSDSILGGVHKTPATVAGSG